jgi:poly-gamma-glutamate synthesis protein (capsule biosynthesis protein)
MPSFGQKVTLLFAGDAMQHQSQIDNAFRDGKYDYAYCFDYIKDEIMSADLAIVNLEVTLAGKPYKGYPQFSAPDEYARALKEAGFTVFLNANNHIVDRSNQGVIRTISILDSMKITHTGVFRDEKEREQKYPLLITKNGIRFALLNYTYGTNGFHALPPVLINYIDKDQMKEDIQKAKNQNADVIVANIHWGEEYKLTQNKVQENLADFLVEQGVDLVIGSHPHVVQPSKINRDSLGQITHVIVYSLGNLISAMTAVNTDGGQMVKVVIEKKEEKIQIKSASYMLLYRHKKKEGEKINYLVIPVTLAEKNDSLPAESVIELDTDSYQKMLLFTKNARATLNKGAASIPEYKPTQPRTK